MPSLQMACQTVARSFAVDFDAVMASLGLLLRSLPVMGWIGQSVRNFREGIATIRTVVVMTTGMFSLPSLHVIVARFVDGWAKVTGKFAVPVGYRIMATCIVMVRHTFP